MLSHQVTREMRDIVEELTRLAPPLTLLVLLAGLVWALATWRAEFETVKTNQQDLKRAIEAQHQTLDDIARDVSFMAGRQAERDRSGAP